MEIRLQQIGGIVVNSDGFGKEGIGQTVLNDEWLIRRENVESKATNTEMPVIESKMEPIVNNARFNVDVDEQDVMVEKDGVPESVKSNPNFIADFKLEKLDDDTKVHLDDVWFVKTMDESGQIKVEPYLKGKSSEYGDYIACINGGWAFKTRSMDAFSVLDGFISAKRWQAMEYETLVVKESIKDRDLEAVKYEERNKGVTPYNQYEIVIDCVITGQTKGVTAVPAIKQKSSSVRKENYLKYLDDACSEICYKQKKVNSNDNKYKKIELDVDFKTVREYANEYSRRVNLVAIERNPDEKIELPQSRHELIQTGPVLLDKLFYVTRKIGDKFEVIPCVVNNENRFLDLSTGNVYNLDSKGSFSTIEGFVCARRWREMELTSLKVVENYKDMTEEGEKYLEKGIFDMTPGSNPYHIYSISVSGVMIDGVNSYLSAHSVSDFRKFRDKSTESALETVYLRVCDPQYGATRKVEDILEFAKIYTDRLNPQVKLKAEKMAEWNAFDEYVHESDLRKKQKQKQKQEKGGLRKKLSGLYGIVTGYFKDKKRLRKAQEKFESER